MSMVVDITVYIVLVKHIKGVWKGKISWKKLVF